jgi:hypothetical protein
MKQKRYKTKEFFFDGDKLTQDKKTNVTTTSVLSLKAKVYALTYS